MAIDPRDEILTHLTNEDGNQRVVTIFRAPRYLKNNTQDFEPLEFPVGFYWHGKLEVEDPTHCDVTKLAVAREFCRAPEQDPIRLTQTKRPIRRERWAEFVASFDKRVMEQARHCYDRLKPDVAGSTDKENSLVILDTLFVLAYFQFEYRFNDCWGYDFQSVFRHATFVSQRFCISRDLVLLENQIPMGLLKHAMRQIHRPDMSEAPDAILHGILQCFVLQVYPFNHGVKLESSIGLQQHMEMNFKEGLDSFLNCDHLLGCAYLGIVGSEDANLDKRSNTCCSCLACLVPSRVSSTEWPPPRNRFRIPSATSLKRVGITVKVRADCLTMKDIKFERQKHKYALLVPKLIMNDNTTSILRNLALYEQIMDNGYCTRGEMRTYLYLMSSLLDSVQDVHLLINRGVIVNQLGSAEAVSTQWNQMCDGLFIPSISPSYWSDVQDRISELERSKSNKWFAEIEERNFSGIFVFLSFTVVCVVFIATILQTVYSILSYYKES